MLKMLHIKKFYRELFVMRPSKRTNLFEKKEKKIGVFNSGLYIHNQQVHKLNAYFGSVAFFSSLRNNKEKCESPKKGNLIKDLFIIF